MTPDNKKLLQYLIFLEFMYSGGNQIDMLPLGVVGGNKDIFRWASLGTFGKKMEVIQLSKSKMA